MPANEPWDARLIARISRGSGAAASERSPSRLAVSLAAGVVSGVSAAALFNGKWWFWVGLIVLAMAIRVGDWLRGRKRRTQPSR